MKIVLIDEVKDLGIAGDVLDVKPGFARNYLIPQNFAVKASSAELARAESRRTDEVERRTRLNTEVEGFLDELQAEPLVMEVRVGPAGRLYGSVTAAEIAEAVGERISKDLDRHAVELAQPIRAVGVQEVRVRLAPDVFATLKVSVEPEGGLPPAPSSESDDEAIAEPTTDEAIAAEEQRIAEEAEAAAPAAEDDTPADELDQPTPEASTAEDDTAEDGASPDTGDSTQDEPADQDSTDEEAEPEDDDKE